MLTRPVRKPYLHPHIGSYVQSRALMQTWKWYHNKEESAKINVYKAPVYTDLNTGIWLKPSLLDY